MILPPRFSVGSGRVLVTPWPTVAPWPLVLWQNIHWRSTEQWDSRSVSLVSHSRAYGEPSVPAAPWNDAELCMWIKVCLDENEIFAQWLCTRKPDVFIIYRADFARDHVSSFSRFLHLQLCFYPESLRFQLVNLWGKGFSDKPRLWWQRDIPTLTLQPLCSAGAVAQLLAKSLSSDKHTF